MQQLDGREIRAQAQKACAIAHGRGAGMSSNELWLIVLKDGLPNEEERERILREKLADDEVPPLPEPSGGPDEVVRRG